MASRRGWSTTLRVGAMQPSQLFAALADLAPASGEQVLDVAKGGQPFAWLTDPDRLPRNQTVDRLAALDALHSEERVLRRGWAWLLGTTEIDGTRRKVRLPLLVQPVRIERGAAQPAGAGRRPRADPAGHRSRGSPPRSRRRPASARPGWLAATGTAAWITAAAEAAGLPVGPGDAGQRRRRQGPDDELVGYAAAALFVARDVTSVGLRDTLLNWSTRPGLEATALATSTARRRRPPASAETEPVRSPLPLNAAQREVVRRTRREPVVVVSGPPGNGKSHAVVAAALDTVDRGGSVLVATQSGYAAEVLGALLARYPGPVPVLFGDAERRDAIATELGRGRRGRVDSSSSSLDEDAVGRPRPRSTTSSAASTPRSRWSGRPTSWPPGRRCWPGCGSTCRNAFEPGFDLPTAAAAGRTGHGRRPPWLVVQAPDTVRAPRTPLRAPAAARRRPYRWSGCGPGSRRPARWRPRPGWPAPAAPTSATPWAGLVAADEALAERGRHRDAAPGDQRPAVERRRPAQRRRAGHRPAGRAQPAPGGAGRTRRRRAGPRAAAVGRHRRRRRGPAAGHARACSTW